MKGQQSINSKNSKGVSRPRQRWHGQRRCKRARARDKNVQPSIDGSGVHVMTTDRGKLRIVRMTPVTYVGRRLARLAFYTDGRTVATSSAKSLMARCTSCSFSELAG